MKVPFQTQEMGYNKEQVDKYIRKLAEEYGKLQDKVVDLTEKAARPEANNDESMKAIAKAMVDAEIKGIHIVTEAKNEAARIIEDAYRELEQIKGAKDRTVHEINDLMKGLKDIVPAAGMIPARETIPGVDLYNVKEMIPRHERMLADL